MVVKRPSAGYQLAMALVALMMISTLLDSLVEFWHMPLTAGPLFLIALAAVVYGWLWWQSPWLGGGATVAAAAGSLVALRNSPGYAAWLSRLVTEATDLIGHLRAAELETTFGVAVGTAMVALIALLAGLLIIWESFSRGTAFWSMAGGLLLFGTQWAWFFDRSASFFMTYTLLALILWTLGQAALRDASWQASGRRIGYRSHVATPVAIVLITSVVGAIMPYEFAPIHLGTVGEKVQEAFPVFKKLRGGGVGLGGGRFSLTATGFSPNISSLGGPVRLDESVALYLSPERPLDETLYLRGATFLVYTGKSWEAGESQKVNIPPGSTLPTGYAPDVPREYVKLKVTPAMTFGRTIFNVLEPMRVDGLKSDYSADSDSNLYADRSIARESTYTVSARLPRYSAEQIRLLSTSGPEGYYEHYLQVPEGLPQRVRDLGREIAGGHQHPYDQALAIESYLRGMRYDLDVPESPPGQDFVDFFLFDLQRGYCTYYATSMVVLLRDLGIPARLVEGFAVPDSAGYTEDAKGIRTYSILNSQAHAWVEAYFPGYGWVTFDPTPRADLPLIARDAPAPHSSGITPGTQGDEIPQLPSDRNEQEFQDPAYAEGGSALANTVSRDWPWFLGPLLFLALMLFVAYRYLLTQDRLTSRESRTLVQEVWEKAGALLARFDFGRPPHQTPREYAATLGDSFPVLKEPAHQAAEDYTIARYSQPGTAVNEGADNRAKSFWQQIHEELFSHYGWRTYLWRRLRRSRKKR